MEDFAQDLAEHRKYLHRFAVFHLRDPSLAEDAVQETLMAAVTHRDRFEGRSTLRTWLTSILLNKIVDLTRKNARGLPADPVAIGYDQDAQENDFDGKGKWADPPADWGLPDDALESKQFWLVYEKCCKRMPERHALAFSMREVLGMTAEEICKKLEISTSNLHVLLFRARLKLRSCMSRNWFGAAHG